MAKLICIAPRHILETWIVSHNRLKHFMCCLIYRKVKWVRDFHFLQRSGRRAQLRLCRVLPPGSSQFTVLQK
jgi:hypothetical protein